MLKKILYLFKIWVVFAKNSLVGWSVNRHVLAIFLFGKLVRYLAYFGFLYYLVSGGGVIGDYTQNQTLLFTATFVLVDTISQFLFRNVYSFRPLVVSGDFDLVLVKPTNALFRTLFGGPDPIDLVTIPPIIAVVIYLAVSIAPSVLGVFYYILLILNALVISAAFHIFVLCLGILTTEVDHTIMVYRDLSSMGRFPVDIYSKPLSFILTFILPIAVMVTIPTKALIGILSPVYVLASLVFGGLLLYLALKSWNFALQKYTSASS